MVVSMRSLHGVIAVGLTLALGACGSSSPSAGGLRQSCFPNGTCNAGLSCLSNVCVVAGGSGGIGGEAGGAGGTAGGAGTGSAGAMDGSAGAGTAGAGGTTAAGGSDAGAGAAGAGTDAGAGGSTALGGSGGGAGSGTAGAAGAGTDAGAAGAGTDAGADVASADAAGGDVALRALGETCLAADDCASRNCQMFVSRGGLLCTQACSADTPCPMPPTNGVCLNKGFCGF